MHRDQIKFLSCAPRLRKVNRARLGLAKGLAITRRMALARSR